MSDIWVIIVSLPLLILTSIFMGLEISFYYAIALFGLSLWLLGTSNKIKRIGIMKDADVRGEYTFVNPLYHLYIWYEAKNKKG